MRTRKLGSSELEVTVVGLGCNNFGGRIDESASKAVIDAALDAGVTFFDTADVYGGGGGSAPVVRLVDVHKSFGPNNVLSGIDLSVASGEVLRSVTDRTLFEPKLLCTSSSRTTGAPPFGAATVLTAALSLSTPMAPTIKGDAEAEVKLGAQLVRCQDAHAKARQLGARGHRRRPRLQQLRRPNR